MAPRRPSVQQQFLEAGMTAAVIQSLLPGIRLRRKGWTPCPCPNPRAHAHGDADPSAAVSVELGRLVCHACGIRADLVELALLLGRAATPGAAAAWLRAEFLERPSRPQEPMPSTVPVSAADRQVDAEALYRRARATVKSWLNVAADSTLGQELAAYSPPWPVEALEGMRAGYLRAVPERGWPARLVFPVEDVSAAVVGVKLRSLTQDVPRSQKSISLGPASRGLIGRSQLLEKPDAVAVVAAGEKDAVFGLAMLRQFAWTSGACGEGTPLGPLVEAYRNRDVLVFLDGDDAGARAASDRAAELTCAARTVRVVPFPPRALNAGAKDLTDLIAVFGCENAARGLRRRFCSRSPEVTRSTEPGPSIERGVGR